MNSTDLYWANEYAAKASDTNKELDLDVAKLRAVADDATVDWPIRGPLQRVLWHFDNMRRAAWRS